MARLSASDRWSGVLVGVMVGVGVIVGEGVMVGVGVNVGARRVSSAMAVCMAAVWMASTSTGVGVGMTGAASQAFRPRLRSTNRAIPASKIFFMVHSFRCATAIW
jgi:hypothetical protein